MNDTVIARSPLDQLRGLVQLVRIRQWVKNGFVIAPLIFTGKFINSLAVAHVLLALLFFCLASSATYILNDIQDIEHDRLHPLKAHARPLAAGRISVRWAWGALLACYGVLLAGWLFMPAVMLPIFAYLALNLAYSLKLKHEPVIDIFTIAIGFVLRVCAGAQALNVPVSAWMFVTTLSLALYLAAVKRRQELRASGSQARQVLGRYSLALIDRYAEMSATGALVFYSLFVLSTRPQLVFTVPLVLFGLFRYWFVVEVQDGGESPTDALLTDRQLQLAIVGWVAACVWALWPR